MDRHTRTAMAGGGVSRRGRRRIDQRQALGFEDTGWNRHVRSEQHPDPEILEIERIFDV